MKSSACAFATSTALRGIARRAAPLRRCQGWDHRHRHVQQTRRCRLVASLADPKAPSIKLTYFPMAGRVEMIRLALQIGGIEFEDERITSDQFAAAKEAGTVPFLSLPTMTVDGEIYAESNAILRYAGKLAGLYPKDEKDALKVDMVIDAMDTLLYAMFKDNSQEAREKLVVEGFPRYMGRLDKVFAETPGPFLLGETISIADLKLETGARYMASGMIDHVPTDILSTYSHVMAAVKAVRENEKVKEWNAAHDVQPAGFNKK